MSLFSTDKTFVKIIPCHDPIKIFHAPNIDIERHDTPTGGVYIGDNDEIVWADFKVDAGHEYMMNVFMCRTSGELSWRVAQYHYGQFNNKQCYIDAVFSRDGRLISDTGHFRRFLTTKDIKKIKTETRIEKFCIDYIFEELKAFPVEIEDTRHQRYMWEFYSEKVRLRNH